MAANARSRFAARSRRARAACCAALLALALPAAAQLKTETIEYYHAGLGHYFITGFLEEIDLLDSGGIPGWTRTGQKFDVWLEPGGQRAEVCRFFSDAFAPKSSHFYTAIASECALLRTGTVWKYEGVVAYVVPPAPDGECPTGVAIYRLYNNVLTGAPNHRYTKSTAIRDQMIASGWTSEGFGAEGVIACVPKG